MSMSESHVETDPIIAVRSFHEHFGLPISDTPTLDVPAELKELRCALIEEEARELHVRHSDRIGIE